MAATSVYIPRVNCDYLLPLLGNLQNQQVCLTWASLKSQLLPYILEHVRFCVHHLMVKSLFVSPLWLPKVSPTSLLSHVLWSVLSWCRYNYTGQWPLYVNDWWDWWDVYLSLRFFQKSPFQKSPFPTKAKSYRFDLIIHQTELTLQREQTFSDFCNSEYNCKEHIKGGLKVTQKLLNGAAAFC